MTELKEMLIRVKDSYFDFVIGILAYAGKNKNRLEKVTDYIKNNPDLSTSDIIYFVSCQPDFYDDMAPEDERVGEPEVVS
ncbi:MAG: hypothetical protein K6F65_08115 [Lachnospiraceae bacterium]|nr:hypothetical protein [Lachnospiraceae bacterium]